MPRRKSGNPPALKRDGDYAVVYLNGKKIRLGRYGTEVADKEYRRIVGEWLVIGDVATTHKTESYLIDELAARFLPWADEVYGNSDFCNYKTAIETMLEIYSGTLVKDFGKRALKTVQRRFVDKGYARDYCNKLTGFVRAMFVWGIDYEYVTEEDAGRLKLVSPVHKKEAPNRPKRKPVPDDVVIATLPHLLPTVADMVRVQRLAVMRPSEVCNMKVGEIDRSRKIWIYVPPEHKNKWRDQVRIIPLGKHEQAILEQRMTGKEPDQYVFTPQEAMRERCERDAANRKTPVQPSQQERKEKRAENPKRKFRECYNASAYRRSITRTIETVNEQLPDDKKIQHWFPYMLRHAAVSDLAGTDGAGLDVARAVAGQKSLSVTMGYNHADVKIAIKAAKRRQNPLE